MLLIHPPLRENEPNINSTSTNQHHDSTTCYREHYITKMIYQLRTFYEFRVLATQNTDQHIEPYIGAQWSTSYKR